MPRRSFSPQVLRKKDEAFLIMFGEEAELLQDYTSSPRLLNQGFNGLRVSSGVGGLRPGPVPTAGGPRGTVLYDAVFLAANDKLKGEVGRKVIVVITDGVDEGSRLTINQAIEAAQKSDAVIYSIDYSDPSAYGGAFGTSAGGGGEATLHQMSDETGGHVYRVDRRHTLDAGLPGAAGRNAQPVFDRLYAHQRRQGRLLPQAGGQDCRTRT